MASGLLTCLNKFRNYRRQLLLTAIASRAFWQCALGRGTTTYKSTHAHWAMLNVAAAQRSWPNVCGECCRYACATLTSASVRSACRRSDRPSPCIAILRKRTDQYPCAARTRRFDWRVHQLVRASSRCRHSSITCAALGQGQGSESVGRPARG